MVKIYELSLKPHRFPSELPSKLQINIKTDGPPMVVSKHKRNQTNSTLPRK